MWQKRVGLHGKLIGKFSSRVRLLLKSVIHEFRARTSGTLTIRERNLRSLELEDTVKLASTNLFNQQVAIAQSIVRDKFKEALLVLPEYNKEMEMQTMRSMLFEFKSIISDIEIEEFDLKLTASLISEFSALLQDTARQLPESSQAKLNTIRRLDLISKSQKKKNTAGINVGMNIVGMLRPSGFGNLQGFVNYGTTILGLQTELLLGFQNDGDSPEVYGDDREYPVLRLQPKFHFDIDV